MSRYRLAKAAEHAVNLEWMRGKLAAFRRTPSAPGHILSQLEREFTEAEKALALLGVAAATPGLEDDADSLSKYLAAFMQVTSVHYIAGLERQTVVESDLRLVLLNACRRLRLDWIQDLLVRLSDHLAILPVYRRRLDMPVFYGPPNLLESFLCLPGIYHEFGHNVFLTHDEFLIELRRAVVDYFDAEKARLGPMMPELRKRREAELDEAAAYWDDLRLTELFCDLFAGYVCGPVNLISIMDLAMADGLPPTELITDYPPNASRVAACHHILSTVQKTQPLLEDMFSDWQDYERRFSPVASYGTFCPPALVLKLADSAKMLLTTLLPNVQTYADLLPTLDEARAVNAGIGLERLLNSGAVVLLEAPTEFDAWWRRARTLVT